MCAIQALTTSISHCRKLLRFLLANRLGLSSPRTSLTCSTIQSLSSQFPILPRVTHLQIRARASVEAALERLVKLQFPIARSNSDCTFISELIWEPAYS